MVSSYQFSERHNVQSVLWAIGGAVVAVVRTLAAVVSLFASLIAGLWAARVAVVTVAKALGIAGGLAVTFALVAAIPVTFWVGLGVVAVFGWVTYPRSK